jgi:Uma2 family endonuclease
MATVVIQNAELTEQAYLDMERVSPIKHEYVAGRLYAMTGSSDAHNIIALNLATILRIHLRGSRAGFSSPM